MKLSKKYTLNEGAFNWLLKTLLGKKNATQLRYWAAIKTDPKLSALSREFEKSAKELERVMAKRMKQPGTGGDTAHYKNLKNLLSRRS
tara:strand:- start:4993 stop:5256 length:264 start_codon:yes stop_codon:yes gene_type:complete